MVDTSPAGSKGSMARYARIVGQALETQASPGYLIENTRVNLRLPVWLTKWLPMSIQVWITHAWILLTAKVRILRLQPHLVHILDGSYGYIAHALPDVPVLATVHDLIPLLQQQGKFGPDFTSLPARRLVKRSVLGLSKCANLISVSTNTCCDLIEAAGIAEQRISVVPSALATEFTAAACGPECSDRADQGEKDRLILHVGHNGHYKNREGVLRIFSLVRRRCKVRLVLAGAAPSTRLLRLVVALGLEDCVEFMQDLDDRVLSSLYQTASLLLFPSIYEGFGWPPLEAMAYGCPVVCSSAASLPEVVGGAALMAPVQEEAELARLCLTILENAGLAKAMAEQGRARARQFTVERMGKQILAVYDRSLRARLGVALHEVASTP